MTNQNLTAEWKICSEDGDNTDAMWFSNLLIKYNISLKYKNHKLDETHIGWKYALDDFFKLFTHFTDTRIVHNIDVFHFITIKQKYNWLHVEYSGIEPLIKHMIQNLKFITKSTCQRCGKKGKSIWINGKLLNLCDNHKLYHTHRKNQHLAADNIMEEKKMNKTKEMKQTENIKLSQILKDVENDTEFINLFSGHFNISKKHNY